MQLAIVAVLLMLAGCGGGGSGGGEQSAGPVGTTPTPTPPAPTPPPPAPPDPTPPPPPPPPDIEPDAFAFGALVDVTPNSLVMFNSIRIAGVNQPVTVAITGGEYAIDDGLFTAASGVARNGQRISVRARASAAFSVMTSGSLAIGSLSREFRVTTEAEDLVPDTFVFDSSVNAAPRATVLSNTVVIAGINSPATVSIQGGSYQIDGGAFTTAPLSIRNGQALTLRITASAAAGTLTRATVSVNSVSAVFNVTTAGTAEFDAPTAAVIFPPRNSATSGATVSVVGTAADAQEITSVRVNGVSATSNDGFANWRAVVPLGAGINTLRVNTTDVAGNTNEAAAEQDLMRHEPLQPPAIGTGLDLNTVGGLTLDPAARRLFGIADSGDIVVIDVVSGDRQILSPATGREGLGFGSGMTLDPRRKRLLLADSTAEAINSTTPFPIIAVSTVDGTRTVVADANTGSGVTLRVPKSIAVDSDNEIAYVSNSARFNDFFGEILIIDLITGERRIFSNAPSHPGKLILDDGRLLVVQTLTLGSGEQPDGLYSLTLADQRLTPIANRGELPPIVAGSALDKKNNQLLFIAGVFEFFSVLDLKTLQTRTLTSTQVGTGESIRPRGVVLDASGIFVYTNSFNPQDRGAVYAIELRSGDRVLISR